MFSGSYLFLHQFFFVGVHVFAAPIIRRTHRRSSCRLNPCPVQNQHSLDRSRAHHLHGGYQCHRSHWCCGPRKPPCINPWRCHRGHRFYTAWLEVRS
ncbi:uncharacterized protein C8R40DRAFT_747941 [Lentinula edodes]|uniref:uncharacterized protein n=1 Tax=Lentinula edodes TaxID=5353 RepID=UPI001E8D8C4F|nr:uncharacterized protein C8R40DRAFT_747941 [Lentinula edodes]KAH7869372.1 hypothetical protein C8R40DRAFT_747941 [Lentinula edodes]